MHDKSDNPEFSSAAPAPLREKTTRSVKKSFPALCRILIDAEPNSGSWNMAVDEVLLESAIRTKTCSVRLYRWSEPTLSLGYFQNGGAADDGLPAAALPRVRRLSGGGAIVHHHEITYSLAVPADHPRAADPVSLYESVHKRILHVLHEGGIRATLRGTEANVPSATGQPFLCFLRGDERDIVLDGHKIGGSAQRRRRGAVLQHGSLILRKSPFAPEVAGLQDAAPQATDFASGPSFVSRLAAAIAGVLSENAAVGELSGGEKSRAAELARDCYRTARRSE